MNILQVLLTLSARGWELTVRDLEFKETKNSFTRKNQRLSKDKLLIPDSKIHQLPGFMSYHTYCFPKDREKAITILKNSIENHYLKFKKLIEQVTAAKNDAYFKNI